MLLKDPTPLARTATPEPLLGGARQVRLLILASSFRLPYRVLRCAAATGAAIYVLGTVGARGLRYSRYCKGYFDSLHLIGGSRDDGLALEINCLARDLSIDVVIPSDHPTTRALTASRDLLEVRCFPMPAPDKFDLLSDKWSFSELCRRLQIGCPAARLYPDRAALAKSIETGEVRFPAVAKPVSSSGGQGLARLDPADSDPLARINYQPIVVQEFVEGIDVSAISYCRGGEIAGFIAYTYLRRAYSAVPGEAILGSIRRIIEPLQIDGVINFDMRVSRNGEIFFLECNPRFSFMIHLAMIAGINFVAMGLSLWRPGSIAPVPAGTAIRYPSAILASPGRWLQWTRGDLVLLGSILSDPLPYFLERTGLL